MMKVSKKVSSLICWADAPIKRFLEQLQYPHQQGDNHRKWFQRSDKALYSIITHITQDKGKTKKVQFNYLQ